jgi:TonB family protein
MARLHPYKNSLGKFCLCLLLLFSATPGHAQDNNARKVLKKAPVGYPYILKSKGIGGVVRLKVFVKPDGTVRDTEVLGGNPILAESAQKSVMQWKFSPGNSETVLEVSVTFDPRSDSGS